MGKDMLQRPDLLDLRPEDLDACMARPNSVGLGAKHRARVRVQRDRLFVSERR